MKHTIETGNEWSWARAAASLGRLTASFEELNEHVAKDSFAKFFLVIDVTNTKTKFFGFFNELQRLSSCGVADGPLDRLEKCIFRMNKMHFEFSKIQAAKLEEFWRRVGFFSVHMVFQFAMPNLRLSRDLAGEHDFLPEAVYDFCLLHGPCFLMIFKTH